MSPAGNISGSSLAALYTSSLEKSLMDFLFLWSISSHGNLKADLMRKNDVMTNISVPPFKGAEHVAQTT